jgi:hypothetical protein
MDEKTFLSVTLKVNGRVKKMGVSTPETKEDFTTAFNKQLQTYTASTAKGRKFYGYEGKVELVSINDRASTVPADIDPVLAEAIKSK